MGLITKLKFQKGKKTSVDKKVKKVDPETAMNNYDEPDLRGGPKASLLSRVLRDHRVCMLVLLLLVALTVPVAVYLELFESVISPDPTLETCMVKSEFRVPCLPGIANISAAMCQAVGCCFNSTALECHHMLPASYAFSTADWSDSESSLQRALDSSLLLESLQQTTPLGLQTKPLQFALSVPSASHLCFQLADVSINIPPRQNIALEDTPFNVTMYGSQFSFDIHRRSPGPTDSGELMLTTARGPMIASSAYWEITIQLPEGAVFGLGNAIPKTKKGSPKAFYSGAERPGSHPFMIGLDGLGDAVGVFVNNLGPMEIELYDESHLMVLRAVAALSLEVHLFAGPTPADVMEQFTAVVGRPALPPYWALGFHVCPQINDTLDPATEFQAFVARAKAAELPWDSHCLDHNVLGVSLGTTERPLQNINFAQSDLIDRKVLLTLPAVVAMDADLGAGEFLLTDDRNATLQGEYGSATVAFPDYWDPGSGAWLRIHLQTLLADVPTDKFGGFVLRDNWPQNDGWDRGGSELLPYLPQELNSSLSWNTVWWRASHVDGVSHYLRHNGYGLQHSRMVRATLDDQQVLLSASTFPGSGAVGGSHVQSGTDVPVTWEGLRETLSSALGLGLSGIPLAGGPVCGTSELFDSDADEELCLRWFLVSAALPFMRAASAFPHRDGSQFPSQSQRYVRQALHLRYSLLPYLHTQFVKAHTSGVPVARPMFFENPSDPLTWEMESQFMLGPALLVAPVLKPDTLTVHVYFPEGNATWHHLEGNGEPLNNGTGGYGRNVRATVSQLVMLIKSGSIVVKHEARQTALASRRSEHTLVVALQCDDAGLSCWASGETHLGEPLAAPPLLRAASDAASLNISNLRAVLGACSTVPTVLGALQVMGLHAPIADAVTVQTLPDGADNIPVALDYRADTGTLWLRGVGLDWCAAGVDIESIVVKW